MKLRTVIIAALAATLAACSGSNKGWSVRGTVADAPEGSKLAVEGYNAGIWYNIDSVAVAPDGKYAFTAAEGSPYPDVYRLSLNGKNIYFPVDSLDALTIDANAAAFDTDYTVSGSDIATAMQAVDKKIAALGTAALTDSLLKRDLNQAILDDPSGVVAYYIINRTVDGKPLYSAADRQDVRMLGAIAQKFASSRPNDPRTAFLERRFLAARSATSGATTYIQADETGLFDIELYDEKGQLCKLTDVTATPGITLLSFTNYDIEPSLAYNVELNRLMEKFPGLKIYQVSFDNDEVAWRQTASNLPWATVRNNPADGFAILQTYNVGALPITFVINSSGDLVDRVADPTALEAAIRKVK